MDQLDGPRVPPVRGGPPKQLVVMVHGYGADGQDLIGLAPYLQRALPDAAFVAPNGPSPCDLSPMGRQWFAIDMDDPSRASNDPDIMLGRFGKMTARADEVAPQLNAFIDRELDSHGLDGTALALVGFSQGTMMSLHVGLHRDPAPAAIVGFSGALMGGETLAETGCAKVPVQLVHGSHDDMVPALAMYQAAALLGRAGVPVGFHVALGAGHTITPDGIEVCIEHLTEAFAGRRSQPLSPISSAL